MMVWKPVCCWAFICSALIVALATGCASILTQPTQDDEVWASDVWPGTTVTDLTEGRALYVSKCSGCHALFAPGRFDANTWVTAVEDMAPRAGASAREEALIIRYIFSQRRDLAAGMKASPGVGRPGVPRSEP